MRYLARDSIEMNGPPYWILGPSEEFLSAEKRQRSHCNSPLKPSPPLPLHPEDQLVPEVARLHFLEHSYSSSYSTLVQYMMGAGSLSCWVGPCQGERPPDLEPVQRRIKPPLAGWARGASRQTKRG